MHIIVNGGAETKQKTLDMFPLESMPLLVDGITRAIGASFVHHKMRSAEREALEKETRRRFDICMKNARELRGDRKWGVTRICDAFGDILKAELNGSKYQPNDARTTWVPSDGS